VVPWIAIHRLIARAESEWLVFPLFLIFHLLRWIQLSRCVRAMDVRLAFAPASDRCSDLDGITAARGKKTSLREIKEYMNNGESGLKEKKFQPSQ
jgi:hypothetical protein